MAKLAVNQQLSPHAPSSTMTGTISVSIADWEKVQQIPKILPQADAEDKKQEITRRPTKLNTRYKFMVLQQERRRARNYWQSENHENGSFGTACSRRECELP
jgi:hypothetical protein